MGTNAVHALYRAFHDGQDCDIGPEVCAVCGGPSADRFSSAKVMADTFQRYDVFRRPESAHVCQACAWYFDAKGQRSGMAPHPQFSRMAFTVTESGQFTERTREEFRAFIDQFPDGPPEPTWVIATRVKKKHIALLADPWRAGDTLTVQWEEDRIVVRREDFEVMRHVIDALLAHGIGKVGIASGQISPVALLKARESIYDIARLNRLLEPLRPSAVLSFALWIAHTPERVPAESKPDAQLKLVEV